jgi:MFS family permease
MTVLTGILFSFGVFFEPIRQSLSLTSARVSLLFSVNTFMLYAVAAVFGFYADRYHPRTLVAGGAVCWALGLVGTGLFRSYVLVLFAYGVVTAIGFGAAFVTIYAAVARWFDQRRGVAFGILSVGWGVGPFVGPGVLTSLRAMGSWQTAYLVLAVPSTAVLLLTALALQRAPPDRTAGADVASDGAGTAATGPSAVGTILRSPRFWLVFSAFLCAWYAYYAYLVHLVPFATAAGLTASQASTALMVVGGASIPARLGAGYLSDRAGTVPLLVVSNLVMGVAVIATLAVRDALGVVAIAALFGVGAGTNAALYSPVVSDLFDLESVGRLLGLTSLGFGVAGAAGPYLTSLLRAATGTYAAPFLAAGTVAAVGTLLFVGLGRSTGWGY